jgi:hypothetical protein
MLDSRSLSAERAVHYNRIKTLAQERHSHPPCWFKYSLTASAGAEQWTAQRRTLLQSLHQPAARRW